MKTTFRDAFGREVYKHEFRDPFGGKIEITYTPPSEEQIRNRVKSWERSARLIVKQRIQLGRVPWRWEVRELRTTTEEWTKRLSKILPSIWNVIGRHLYEWERELQAEYLRDLEIDYEYIGLDKPKSIGRKKTRRSVLRELLEQLERYEKRERRLPLRRELASELGVTPRSVGNRCAYVGKNYEELLELYRQIKRTRKAERKVESAA